MRETKTEQETRSKNNIDAINFALKDSLKFKHNRTSIIHSDPTKTSFLFWFFVSCYFPVITACLGPIANTISIACVVEKWREYGTPSPQSHNGDINSHQIRDPNGIFAVNVISLVLGFISNIVLFCHFARKLSYHTSQLINITGWTVAGILLMVDVIVCSEKETHSDQQKTIGFWYACITAGLYLGCTITLTLHFIGYKLSKYPATFNLLPNERSIMVFTVFLSLWLIWGAGLFSGLLNISFGNALYYCCVSLLTVGFGDILPMNVASKIMILVFSLSGIIILGLIVYTTRSIIHKSSGPVWYFHRLETSRSNIWKKVVEGKLTVSDEEAFSLMTKMKSRAILRGKISSIVSTMLTFIIFWLFGALVFHYSEGWSYFNAMYFCFLCLLTIGYGSDFAPSTGAGRAFFVIWGIGAIPLMGAIISTIGDVLFDLSDKLDFQLARKLNIGIDTIKLLNKSYEASFKLSTKEATDNEEYHGDDNNDDSKDTDSNSLGLLENITEKATVLENNSNNLINNMESISDEEIFFDIIPPLTDDNMASNVSLEKILTNRSSIENSKFDRLKHLLNSLKLLHKISLENKNFKLSYEQWTNIHSIYPAEDLLLDETEMQNFWISERTPLKFPLNESHFAFLRVSEAVDRLVDEIIEEQENTYSMLLERRSSIPNNVVGVSHSGRVTSGSHLVERTKKHLQS